MNKITILFSKTEQPSLEPWRQIAVFVVTLLALFPIFTGYFLHPNSLNYTVGGDGLVQYYNMVYHLRFDHGQMLQDMNYPYGEYIFLTDAQGALATLLQLFSHHVFDISQYAVGIIHVVNLWLLPVCSLIVYQILHSLKVQALVRIPLAVLITIMAPQVLRLEGHFGLAYPFLIPLCMLWFLRKYRLEGRLEWRDLGLLGVLVFFTFNNPYTGFSAAGLLITSGGLLVANALFSKKQLRTGILATAVGTVAMLVPYLDFHFNDPVDDRIVQQFGFFFYHASLDGLLFPPGSLLNHLMRLVGIKYTKEIQIESVMGIGLIASLLFVALTLRGIIALFFKQKPIPKLLPPALKLLLGGSVVLYLLAANYSLYGWAKDWMEDNLGPLLMFKAAGRIGWSFYYTITVSAVVFLDFLLRKLKQKAVFGGLLLLVILVWSLEFNLFMGQRFRKSSFENTFSKKMEQELLASLASNQVDVSNYSAILSLPKMMAWSDLFRSKMWWPTQYYSMRISAATGLPMLNAMLSRISTGQCAEGVQLTSHPIIEKKRLEKLPKDKDILLVVGTDNTTFNFREQYLIDHAKLVMKATKFSLYRLSLTEFSNSEFRDLAQADRATKQGKDNPGLFKLGFDDRPSPHVFYGKGAMTLPKGKTTLTSFKSTMAVDTQFVFGVWHYLDYHRYGLGKWEISVADSTGKVAIIYQVEPIEAYDIQDGWVRSEETIKVPAHGTVVCDFQVDHEIVVDELLLYPVGSTNVYEDPDASEFIWNGYRVKKQAGQ